MSFSDLLATPTFIAPDGKQTTRRPRATEEIKSNGERVIQTGLIDGAIGATDEYLEAAGFDPKKFMLKPGTGIRKSDWQAMRRVDDETIIEPMQSVRLEVVERQAPVDMDELIAAVERQEPPAPQWRSASDLDSVFVVALGDLQLGKHSGKTTPEAVVANFKDYVGLAVERFRRSRMRCAHIAFLGDCIEGFVSQRGKNAWSTSLTTTEQVRILRRLMLWAIDQFLDAGAARITVVSVPGNHDEVMREPVTTRSDDSWAMDALVAVSDAMELNDRYQGVECYVPGVDEDSVTLNVGGVVIGHVHGHKFLRGDLKKSTFTWWESNAFSGQPIGQATLLLTGHSHHHQIAERSGRTWVCTPALENDSTWWLQSTGQDGDPGVVIAEIAGGTIETLTRLRIPGGAR